MIAAPLRPFTSLAAGSTAWAMPPADGVFWPLIGLFAGLVAGSFLATLVVRWPRGQSMGGRSRCDGCGRGLGFIDLVPLLGYLVRRGRCQRCGARIDWRHPAIELTAALVGLMAMLAAPGTEGLAGALFGWILVALLALDAEHMWLPDRLTLPLLALGLILGRGEFTDRLLGAALGGGGLLAIGLLYRAVRKREGLGLGDVKLMAALGAWLSPWLLPPLMLAAALAGLLLAAAGGGRQIAFGACLAAVAFPLWLAAVTLGLP